MSDLYDGMNADQLRRFVRQRDRQLKTQREFWIRASKRALAGDMIELRTRVALMEAPPVDVALS